MNKESKMKEYTNLIEEYLIKLGQISYDVTSFHLEKLENSILDYLHTDYPNISISRKEIGEVLNRLYQSRHFNLKKTIECNLGKTKYEYEDNSKELETLIQEEINKLRTLFSSVSMGTNIHYLGLVNDCTQEVMAMLIRKNTSISFAKDTELVRNKISDLVKDSYIAMMNNLGDTLLSRIVEPLQNKYNIKSKEHVMN